MTKEIKICSECNLQVRCKGLCKSHYDLKYKEEHKEAMRLYRKEYRQANLAKEKEYDKIYSITDTGRFFKAKSKAKTRKLEFSLTYEQFIAISGSPCYYCNDELCGREVFSGAHLDRIDNSKGLDNVVSCGILCNKIRMNQLSVDETVDAIQGILSGRKRRNKL